MAIAVTKPITNPVSITFWVLYNAENIATTNEIIIVQGSTNDLNVLFSDFNSVLMASQVRAVLIISPQVCLKIVSMFVFIS